MLSLRKRSFCRSPDAGSILVMTIWVLVTLAILGVGISRITASQIRLAKRLEERLLSQFLAQAAVLHARVERKHDDTAYDTFAELRATRRQELGRGAFEYTLVDEESRLNINTVPQETLARLPGLGLDGAVAMTASTLRPFHLAEELLLLDAITPQMLQDARALITVYGSGRVNLNTAPPAVLSALGLDDRLVTIIREYREGMDAEEGTADDGIFETSGEIVSELRAYTGLFEQQEAALIGLISQGLLDVKSALVSLQVTAELFGKPVSRYTIVLDGTQGEVKRWEEL